MPNSGYEYGSQVTDTITAGSTGAPETWDDVEQSDNDVFLGTEYDMSGKAGVEVELSVDNDDPGDYIIEFLKGIGQTRGQKTLTLSLGGVSGVEVWKWNFSAADFQKMLIRTTNSSGTLVSSTVKFTPFDIPPAS
jgi:hypothetical protein